MCCDNTLRSERCLNEVFSLGSTGSLIAPSSHDERARAGEGVRCAPRQQRHGTVRVGRHRHRHPRSLPKVEWGNNEKVIERSKVRASICMLYKTKGSSEAGPNSTTEAAFLTDSYQTIFVRFERWGEGGRAEGMCERGRERDIRQVRRVCGGHGHRHHGLLRQARPPDSTHS